MTLNVLSLFSGIGGIDLGLERSGMTVVGQVEIDEYCRRVLAKHWPKVPQHDDVRTCVEWWQSEPRPTVDLICGGPPCQPVSLAGRQRFTADGRWMWPAMADAVRALQPRYILIENVPGLFVRGLDVILADLAEIGFDAEWDTISAASVGAPHRRDRVFIVAHTTRFGWREGRSRRPASDGQNGSTEWTEALGESRIFRTPPQKVYWAAKSDLGRGTDGFSAGLDRIAPWERGIPRTAPKVLNWSDRIKALGNAVVPQVAEHAGRLIVDFDRAREEIPA